MNSASGGHCSPLVLALSLALLIPPAASLSAPALPQSPAASGESSPPADLPLVDAEGYRKLLHEYRGKPLLVNFWATWCEPCRFEYPDINLIAREYSPRGLVVLGVSFDDDGDLNILRRFLARHLPVFRNVRMKPGNQPAFVRAVDPAWRGGIPATLLYDRNGRIVQRFDGPQKREVFARAVEELLGPASSAAR